MSIDTPAPFAIAFVGRQNSGKTTIIIPVIEELTARGYRVGSIKHHGQKGFDIDVKGKDSWRHKQAGSLHTVIASPDRIASIRDLDEEIPLGDIIATMNDVDVVVVEDHHRDCIPYVELFREANKRDHEAFEELDTFDQSAIITDMNSVRQMAMQHHIPCFAFDDIDGVVDFIETTLISKR